MMALSAGFLCGITLFEYIAVSPEDQHVARNEVEIEGLPLDENLIGAIVSEAENAGGLVNIHGDSKYHHIAQYMNRAMKRSFRRKKRPILP